MFPCIIVVGVTHHNTIGMVRCIGMAGYRVEHLILTDGKVNSYVAHSKYVKNTHFCLDENSLLDTLKACYNNDGRQYFVFPCTDAAASVIDKNYNSLKSCFVLFNASESGRITQLMNKETQVEYAQNVGLKVPASFYYSADTKNIPFPCLIKYALSINGGKKVKICYNEEELLMGINDFDIENPVLVQEYVKKESEIVVLGLSVNGQVYIPGYILKHRDYDGGTNYSSVLPINNAFEDLAIKCKELIHSISYEGLFGIEFINNGHDYYFIEINLRNDATTFALAMAGANLPYIYIRAKSDGFIPDKNSFEVRPIKSIVEYNDLKHRKEFGISFIEWIMDFLTAECKYYFNFRDPIPFFIAPFK